MDWSMLGKIVKIQGIMEAVIAVVHTVENYTKNFPEMSGEQKKTNALLILGNVYAGLQKFGGIKEIQGIPWEVAQLPFGFLIDIIVNAANIFGIFTHKS